MFVFVFAFVCIIIYVCVLVCVCVCSLHCAVNIVILRKKSGCVWIIILYGCLSVCVSTSDCVYVCVGVRNVSLLMLHSVHVYVCVRACVYVCVHVGMYACTTSPHSWFLCTCLQGTLVWTFMCVCMHELPSVCKCVDVWRLLR